MRWEVFKQDAPSKPHQAVGSVHGADAEHALLNARHVFGRRPAAISMWVVRADRIYGRTAEELAAEAPRAPVASGNEGTYHVFRKASHRRSMTFVDHLTDVRAAGPSEALAVALAGAGAEPGLAWWVVDANDVHATDPDAAASWFEPAKDKTYKQQSQYGTVAAKRNEGAAG